MFLLSFFLVNYLSTLSCKHVNLSTTTPTLIGEIGRYLFQISLTWGLILCDIYLLNNVPRPSYHKFYNIIKDLNEKKREEERKVISNGLWDPYKFKQCRRDFDTLPETLHVNPNSDFLLICII